MSRQQFQLIVGDGQTRRAPRRSKPEKRQFSDPWRYLGLVGDLGFSLALPIAGGAFIGTIIDQKMMTYPTATLALLLVGIGVSCINLIIVVRQVLLDQERTKN